MKKLLFILPVLALTACASNTIDPNQLSYEQAQNVTSVKRGVVISIERAKVKIDGTNTAAAGGAVAGGIAGSQMSSGSGRDVAIAVGALAGAAIGKVASGRTEEGFAYTVETKGGKLIQVVQSGLQIPVATKVLIKYYAGGRTAISIDQSQGKVFSRTQGTKYDTPAPATNAPMEDELYQYNNEELYSPEEW